MRKFSPVASCLLVVSLAACQEPLPDYDPTFHVFPTPEGADIVVDVRGGPQDRSWVGFGAGPGAADAVVERVHSVQAHSADGTPLPVTDLGDGGFLVEVNGQYSWKLSYSLDLLPASEEDTFYRSSVRGADYLVLVGTDAWARFYTGPEALSFRPGNRPSGMVVGARVSFALPDWPQPWTVASTARETAHGSFVLDDHPAASVFAAGTFELGEPHPTTGLRLAVHRDWNVMRGSVNAMSQDLLLALQNRMGPPGTEQPLALMMPVPPSLQLASGLRTAGMASRPTRGSNMPVSCSTTVRTWRRGLAPLTADRTAREDLPDF